MKIDGFPRIKREFTNAIRRSEPHFPSIGEKVSVCVTPLAGMTGRAYGYYDEVDSTISLSPRLEAEPIERIQGIVYHELGHAASHLYEAMKTVQMGEENKADAIASAITQRPMRYDRWDVQTTGSGSVVRPGHLHE